MEYELFEQFCSKDNRNCTCTFDDDGDLEETNPTCPVSGHSGYVTAASYSCFFSNVWCVLTIEYFTGLSRVFASLQMASTLPVEAGTIP